MKIFVFSLSLVFPTKRDKSEHMWFEMQNITEEFIQGILINEPYFIEDMSEGNSYHLDFDDLTEWVIYAGDAVIKPNNLYMFIGE